MTTGRMNRALLMPKLASVSSRPLPVTRMASKLHLVSTSLHHVGQWHGAVWQAHRRCPAPPSGHPHANKEILTHTQGCGLLRTMERWSRQGVCSTASLRGSPSRLGRPWGGWSYRRSITAQKNPSIPLLCGSACSGGCDRYRPKRSQKNLTWWAFSSSSVLHVA